MDPLSDIIALLRPSTAVAKPITGRGRWGVRYEAHHAPGFTIILRGECWLACAGMETLRLQEGDFILLPSAPAFTLGSHPDVECKPASPMDRPVRHGEQAGEAEFESLGGTFHIEPTNAPLLLSLLPRIIHIPAAEGRSGRIGGIVALIIDECGNEAPGKEMILRRMLDVLLIEALRWRGLDLRAGLLGGLRDPGLARVLRALHADIRADWTVAGLAKVAGLSRSAFAARFSLLLGCGPMEYLIRWRMALAKDALTRGTKTLDGIADEIGYESASSFSTAFRKRQGCSPGKFARGGAVARPEPGASADAWIGRSDMI